MAKIYRKLTEEGLDKKDIEILWELSQEREFTQEDLKSLAEKVKISVEDVKKRIQILKEKKIVLKDKVSIIDQVRIWDGYYIVLVKAAIQPPVIGMETKFPTGWVIGDYISGIKQVEKDLESPIVRHAYILQGTEWDLCLIVSADSQDQLGEFCTELSKQGWVSKVWSFTPLEWKKEWIFDPIAAPDPKKVNQVNKEVLEK